LAKQKVLDFSEHLAACGSSEAREPRLVKGTGGALLAFAGAIPADDLEIMRRTIEEDCERVNKEGW
jgi:hypothetical protein